MTNNADKLFHDKVLILVNVPSSSDVFDPQQYKYIYNIFYYNAPVDALQNLNPTRSIHNTSHSGVLNLCGADAHLFEAVASRLNSCLCDGGLQRAKPSLLLYTDRTQRMSHELTLKIPS